MKDRKLTKKEALEFAKENINRISLKSISRETGWSVATFNRAGVRVTDAIKPRKIPEEIKYTGKLVYISEWRATVKLHANTTLEEYMKKVQETRDRHLSSKL